MAPLCFPSSSSASPLSGGSPATPSQTPQGRDMLQFLSASLASPLGSVERSEGNEERAVSILSSLNFWDGQVSPVSRTRSGESVSFTRTRSAYSNPASPIRRARAPPGLGMMPLLPTALIKDRGPPPTALPLASVDLLSPSLLPSCAGIVAVEVMPSRVEPPAPPAEEKKTWATSDLYSNFHRPQTGRPSTWATEREPQSARHRAALEAQLYPQLLAMCEPHGEVEQPRSAMPARWGVRCVAAGSKAEDQSRPKTSVCVARAAFMASRKNPQLQHAESGLAVGGVGLASRQEARMRNIFQLAHQKPMPAQ